MDIGVVTVRDDGYHPNRRLMEAAADRGCSLGLLSPYRVGPWIDRGSICMYGMEGPGIARVLLPRQGAQIGASSLTVLSHFAAMGIPLVNDVYSIRIAGNKFLTVQALVASGLPVPDTVFANSGDVFFAGIQRLGGFPVVAKKLRGRQGAEVFLLTSRQDAERIVDAHLEPGKGILLQAFIAPEGRRDLRLLVIGGNVAAAAEFFPKPGDFRSNFHLGGNIRAVSISGDIEKLAADSSRAVGLDIAGVDLVVDAAGAPWVIEVNYSPGFRGLEAATGRDIAAEIIDFTLSFI
ncbi:MAG: RimK family alpha-L-glutamate ligase [Desulfobacterales bacterium]